jgi:hypothetical protein
MSRQEIYCGNNLYDVANKRIGTPYECLKKGVGQGYRSDLSNFNPRYQAIITDNMYCGTGPPPVGKVMGTPTACLRKGVGIGKKLRYNKNIEDGEEEDELDENTPTLLPQRVRSSDMMIFLVKWWPVILALLVGVVALIFKAEYTVILLSMIAVLITGWFIQSVMNK